MKNKHLIITLLVSLMAVSANAEVVYEPLIVASGFNRDVIAESTPLNTSKVTSYLQETGFYYSMATESVIRTINNNYQASHPGYFSDANLVDIPLQGWPDDPTNDPANRIIRCREDGDAINDPLYKDVFFQLAPYNENNVLTLRPDNSIGGTGTLKFKKVGCYDKVFFLLMSAFESQKPSVRQVATTIYYTDGTSEDEIFEFAGLSGKTGHNVRKTNIYEDKYKKWSQADGNKAYAAIFDMNVDQSKLIDRIEFRNTINYTAVVIFAVTGRTADVAAPTKASITTSNVDETSFRACWDAISEAESYRLDVAEDSAFQHILAAYNNLEISDGTCADVENLIATNDYYWRVRSVNSAGGQSASSAPRRVKLVGSEPALTAENDNTIEDDLGQYLGNQNMNIIVNRTLWKDGAFNTLCLPFDLSAAQIAAHDKLAGCELYTFDYADVLGTAQLDIHVSHATSITAGVPYLIKWANTGETIDNLLFSGVTITTDQGLSVGEEGQVQFVGILGKHTLPYENVNNLFLGANNTLYWPLDDGTSLKGFRAYFSIPTSGPQAAPKNTPARIVMGQQVATDIENTSNEKIGKCENAKILRNGQLFIIRDGKTYDFFGRLVD